MRRLLIIGIDGADWQYTSERIQKGELPVLGELAANGAFGPLASTAPPMSSPAWPAMTTGMSPESLGIYDLTVPDGYGKRAVSARDVGVPRLWDYVGAEGGRSVIMNVPVTWPPRPIEGVLVAGFLTPRGEPFCYPQEVGRELAKRFRYSPEHAPSRRDKLRSVTRRTKAFLHLLRKAPWTVAMLVFSETDWAQHEHWEDRVLIDRLFDRVDAAAGRLISETGAENVAIVSDHGFTAADRVLNANRVLADLGFLTYGTGSDAGDYRSTSGRRRRRPSRLWQLANRAFGSPRIARALHRAGMGPLLGMGTGRKWQGLGEKAGLRATPVNWARTRAYLYNGTPQAIRINLRGREPEGIVDAADFEATCDALMASLAEVRDPVDGELIFTSARRRESADAGNRPELAPDVFFDVRDDRYVVSIADHPRIVWQTGRTRGRHRTDGIYAFRGPGFRAQAGLPASIVDMMPTLLAAIGLPVPEGLDGRPDPRLLAPDLAPSAKRYNLQFDESPNAADDGSVMERLADLGYL
jgi:predicted AlkP superfamily phosphohydrolase/phosphomutase